MNEAKKRERVDEAKPMEQIGERQFRKSGRVVEAAINNELAMLLPHYRREMIQQLLQLLGGRALEFDSMGEVASIEYVSARYPLCRNTLIPKMRVAPADPMVVLR